MYMYLISVGSNIEPQKNIEHARRVFEKETRLLGASRPIVTAPVGYQYQPDFLNCAFYVGSPLNPKDFRAFLKNVETRLGRVRGPIKSGPRTIDLDIIAIDNKIIDQSYYDQEYVRNPIDELIKEFGLCPK